ncbi:acyl carrier protein [Chitinophaga sp. Cy-1792]|uniref:acyl carrier protein n=1 Tax=Chitinophaga sp. Cy-1792 TaxID=2608339 RepID=UPI001421AC43|nr:acyl carrier protein [Chitinophaga sp. Cy-1792]NIG52084.1 acyl carrier protein [Chitinophaga sp. Cy-1792]
MNLDQFIGNFKSVYDKEPAVLEGTSQFRNIDGWDSMTELALIAMLDDEYNVNLDVKDLTAVNTVEELYQRVLQEKQTMAK